jgi:hypothetical protein
MSTNVMAAFEEVYKNPQWRGHESKSYLRYKYMEENVNVGNTLIDGYSSSFSF